MGKEQVLISNGKKATVKSSEDIVFLANNKLNILLKDKR
jgi:hypothetical protein